MSSSFEKGTERQTPSIREQIQALEAQLAALRVKEREEKQAAIDLAKEDRLLMSDPPTRYVVEHDGKTPDGREVGEIGEFLAVRRKELETNPPYLSGGKRRLSPDTEVVHSKSWEEKESHQ
jgi:hypothetical protein